MWGAHTCPSIVWNSKAYHIYHTAKQRPGQVNNSTIISILPRYVYHVISYRTCGRKLDIISYFFMGGDPHHTLKVRCRVHQAVFMYVVRVRSTVHHVGNSLVSHHVPSHYHCLSLISSWLVVSSLLRVRALGSSKARWSSNCNSTAEHYVRVPVTPRTSFCLL